MITVVVGGAAGTQARDAIIFDSLNFSVDAVREALETPSLFGGENTITLTYLLDDFHDEVFELLEQYTDTPNTITIREREVSAADEKKLTKLGATILGKAVVKKPVSEFNIWKLTDALLARDKKQAWLLYREAIDMGTAPEEIGGILWWQMKTLLLVAREGNPADVKPFAVTKAKRALQKYSTEDLAQLSKKLLAAIHEPRAGNGKAEETLEAFVLSL